MGALGQSAGSVELLQGPLYLAVGPSGCDGSVTLWLPGAQVASCDGFMGSCGQRLRVSLICSNTDICFGASFGLHFVPTVFLRLSMVVQLRGYLLHE